MSPRLLLDSEPRSVRRARAWVVEAFHGLGREDLIDAAELGVSELVTNAILHAAPPITVRVLGSARHPRVEVQDGSVVPPSVNAAMAEDEHLLRTLGRGLGLLALCSAAWGADVSPAGKVIWFEPADEPHPMGQTRGSIYDLRDVVKSRLAAAPNPRDLLRVQLIGMPVGLFADFRNWYAEIRRELRLVGLAHPGDYPVATAMSELTLQVEAERAQSLGIGDLDAAIAAKQERVDLDYFVVASTPQTMRRMDELLDRVDAFCVEHQLLATPAAPQLVRLRRWYMGEFVRQAAGATPTPWPGTYAADSSRR
ncbi:hypothetical protein BH18ACT9_BH18ACT9_01310 [soil metagenome]